MDAAQVFVGRQVKLWVFVRWSKDTRPCRLDADAKLRLTNESIRAPLALICTLTCALASMTGRLSRSRRWMATVVASKVLNL